MTISSRVGAHTVALLALATLFPALKTTSAPCNAQKGINTNETIKSWKLVMLEPKGVNKTTKVLADTTSF